MKIELIFSLVTALTSIIAIIISIATLKQSSKNIFEASKANIVFYVDYDITNLNAYLVLKNFGNSSALIKSITYSDDFPLRVKKVKQLKNFSNYVLAPNQKIFQFLDATKLTDFKTKATVTYETLNKIETNTFYFSFDYIDSLHSNKPDFENNNKYALRYINNSLLGIQERLL
ncbi:MAG: hypothetical protein ACTTGJ_02220 [Clostridium sp.]